MGYVDRVRTEKKNLDARIIKLAAFLFSEASAGIESVSEELLRDQLFVMSEYSKILGKRLALA